MTTRRHELRPLLDLMRSGDFRAALEGLRRYSAALPASHPLRTSLEFNIGLCRRRLALMDERQPPTDLCRVGVIAPSDRTKGLYRDVETVVWALSADPGMVPSVLEVPANLYRFPYQDRLQHRFSTNEGERTLAAWLRELDLLVVFEALNPSLVRLARNQKTSVAYVPNLEWATLSPDSNDVRAWEQALCVASDVVTTIARTASIESLLRQRGVPCVRIDWSIPDAVVDRHPRVRQTGQPLKVLFNAGNFGFMERRGLDIVLKSLSLLPANCPAIDILLKGNKSRSELEQLQPPENVSIRVDTGFLPGRDAVIALYDDADLVLYPSRFEGLGLSLLEALHRGCFVLATDGEPMSELLPAEFPRIAAEVSGRLRHAYTYEPSASSLAALLADAASRPDAVRRVPARMYRERQDGFRAQMTALCHVLAAR